MERKSFSLTYDYRCPFARNANEHVVAALRDNAPFDVNFIPFVLGISSRSEDATSFWEDSTERPGLLALGASVIVRDRFPEKFLDTHIALFDLRHELGGDIRDEHTIRTTLTKVGVDADQVFEDLATHKPYELLQSEYENAVNQYAVFGVPTFIAHDQAVFVRLMTRPEGNGALATRTIELVLELLAEHPELNEFKYTTIAR